MIARHTTWRWGVGIFSSDVRWGVGIFSSDVRWGVGIFSSDVIKRLLAILGRGFI